VLSSVSEALAVSAVGAATSQPRRRQKSPEDEAEDIVELSAEAQAASHGEEEEDETSHDND